MHPRTIRRTAILVLTFLTLLVGLFAPTAIASAMPMESGLTSCNQPGCTVVTLQELRESRDRAIPAIKPMGSNDSVGLTACDGANCAIYSR